MLLKCQWSPCKHLGTLNIQSYLQTKAANGLDLYIHTIQFRVLCALGSVNRRYVHHKPYNSKAILTETRVSFNAMNQATEEPPN